MSNLYSISMPGQNPGEILNRSKVSRQEADEAFREKVLVVGINSAKQWKRLNILPDTEGTDIDQGGLRTKPDRKLTPLLEQTKYQTQSFM